MNNGMKRNGQGLCAQKRNKFFGLVGRQDKRKGLRRMSWAERCYQGQVFNKACQYFPDVFTLE